jgi:hypothetical protein
MSGAWGGGIAASGVRVEIIQHHLLSTDTTVIWSGSTNAAGQFSGTSSEWRRMITVRAGPVQGAEPDPADVLALTAKVTDPSTPNSPTASFPFVFVGDNVPSPPIVLNVRPPTARKGSVNGAECFTYQDLISRDAAAFAAGGRVALQLNTFGPQASAATTRLKSDAETMWSTVAGHAQAIQAEIRAAVQRGDSTTQPGQDAVEATADVLLASAARVLQVQTAHLKPLVTNILRSRHQWENITFKGLAPQLAGTFARQVVAELPAARASVARVSLVPILTVTTLIVMLIILSLVSNVTQWAPYFLTSGPGTASVPVVEICALILLLIAQSLVDVMRRWLPYLGLPGEADRFFQQYPSVPIVTICVLILWMIVASLFGYVTRWLPYVSGDVLIITVDA